MLRFVYKARRTIKYNIDIIKVLSLKFGMILLILSKTKRLKFQIAFGKIQKVFAENPKVTEIENK